MNNKKKNKNKQNKPPNLVPPQKSEAVSENLDKKLNVPVEKEDLKIVVPVEKVEPVGDIPSKPVHSPIDDGAEHEGDSPKKPKRNRGKKKKQGGGEDFEDEKDSETVATQKIISKTPEPQLEIEERVEDVKSQAPDSDFENVVPSARKKKNKNKKQGEPPASDKSDVTETKPEPKAVEVSEPLVEVLAEKPSEAQQSKKKNKKKKNRNDSEKSEKIDDFISCTSAFQKLIDKKDETSKDELKPDIITDDSSISEATVKEVQVSRKENVDEKSDIVQSEVPDSSKEGGKGKKKNKKDKKNAQLNKDDLDFNASDETKENKSEIAEMSLESYQINEGAPPPDLKIVNVSVIEKTVATDDKTKVSVECLLPFKEKSPIPQAVHEEKERTVKDGKKNKNVAKEESVNVTPQNPEILEQEVFIKESKIQAKIVKPVEKKSKGKDRKKNEENVTDIKESNILHHGDDNVLESSEKKAESSNKNNGISKPSETRESEQKDNIQNLKILQAIPQEQFESKEAAITDTNISFEDKKKTFTDPLLDITKTEDLHVKIENKQKMDVRVESEKIIEKDTKKIESIRPPEENMNKKRKKSPKPSPKHKTTSSEEPKNVSESFTREESVASPVAPKESELKTADDPVHISKILPSTENTPDVVEHPRCSSELADNNNNMIIQEVTSTNEDLSNIQLKTLNVPLVQGSGETPLVSPEIVQQVDIQVTEIKVSDIIPKEQEKTDLKSKVMEVNQDMEELRKSIERSLAELTAMESSEQKIEDKFEKRESEKSEPTPIIQIPLPSELLSKYREEESTKPEIETEKIIDKEILSQQEKEVTTCESTEVPICPARKDNKGKGKSKKKGKQEASQTAATTSAASATAESKTTTQETKTEEKSESKTETQKTEKNKKQTDAEEPNPKGDSETHCNNMLPGDFEPIESFDDALTSSVEDVNKTFEIIANEANDAIERTQPNPEINITAPDDNENEKKEEKTNPVSQPKNLLGHPDIPVPSNKTDYKKEKNKTPNTRQAKVKIKDAVPIEAKKQSTETQTDIKQRNLNTVKETIASVRNENEEFIYKYSFRKVYLPSACHVCTKDLKMARVACSYCNLLFYCSTKHKDENWPQHQAFCFAISTIAHLKNQKFIYADSKDVTGHNYRLLRMQMIISCEKVLKRKLAPWEQEVLLYPRMCAEPTCREWRQSKLTDCEVCGQMAFCSQYPEHLPKLHQRWCKSYSLYQKLVTYQQTQGRLEPKMPKRVLKNPFVIPDKINMMLASLYQEKIDMNDMQYAALTQLATAPLTAAHCYQLYTSKMNAVNANGYNKIQKTSLTVHVVGAELQFEADALHKWEVFLVHLVPAVATLLVVLIAPDLNPSNLPLELLGKISLCNDCKENNRKVSFSFQDQKTYYDYWSSNDFTTPDLVCAFNPSIHRSSAHNGKDPWPSSINCILKQKVPFIITSYTITELNRDLVRIKECSSVEYSLVSEPKFNNFASVRPDRNFISDDEMPLLFKNYCYMMLIGAL